MCPGNGSFCRLYSGEYLGQLALLIFTGFVSFSVHHALTHLYVPSLSIFFADRCHGVMSHDVITHQKLRKLRFSSWRPWPLTHDPDLLTHPRYYQGQCLHQILGQYAEGFSCESTHRRTDRQTDRQDRFHTLDRWCRREKLMTRLSWSNDVIISKIASDFELWVIEAARSLDSYFPVFLGFKE